MAPRVSRDSAWDGCEGAARQPRGPEPHGTEYGVHTSDLFVFVFTAGSFFESPLEAVDVSGALLGILVGKTARRASCFWHSL